MRAHTLWRRLAKCEDVSVLEVAHVIAEHMKGAFLPKRCASAPALSPQSRAGRACPGRPRDSALRSFGMNRAGCIGARILDVMSLKGREIVAGPHTIRLLGLVGVVLKGFQSAFATTPSTFCGFR